MLVLLPVQRAQAATITVNTTVDELNADGNCSLREAIQAANTDASVDACTVGSGADTINVPAGTYTLSIAGAGEDANASGDLDITSNLSLIGAGATHTIIDGGRLDRVLNIVVGGVAEVSGATVRNGYPDEVYGGGITNSGTLTINDSVISDNTASSLGGGVYNGGTLTVNDSTLSANFSGAFGGGIVNVGTAALTNVTITGNRGSDGGGFFNRIGANASLTNVTVSSNISGLYAEAVNAPINLKNTIVAGNDPVDCGGDIRGYISMGYNLGSDGSCNFSAAGDRINTDPLLGPLADNGGPTQTQALLAGSPAIDAGSPDCPPPATDQRGVTRPQGAICDIGAFERERNDITPPTITLTTPPDGSVYSLKQVVNASYACADEPGGSGLAACTGTAANGAAIDTASVGMKTFTVNARDNAGNTASATHTYNVVYHFSGFFDPVNNPPTVNTGKSGRTYPVKWQLFDASGSYISTLSAVASITYKPTSCSAFTADSTDALETTATGGTGLRYDSTTNQYVYNWAAPSTGCYTLFVSFNDRTSQYAYFKFTK